MKIFDNGGKTIDRYTVVIEVRRYYAGYWSYDALGLSDDPDSPLGFSQWTSVLDATGLGKEITFSDLPENVQKHVLMRLEED